MLSKAQLSQQNNASLVKPPTFDPAFDYHDMKQNFEPKQHQTPINLINQMLIHVCG